MSERPLVHHDEEAGTFRVESGAGEAVLRYREVERDAWDLYSTYTPPAARGQGLAAIVTRAALAEAAARGKRVIPSCSYVAQYIGSHGTP